MYVNKLRIAAVYLTCMLTVGCSFNPVADFHPTGTQATAVGGEVGNKAPNFSLTDMTTQKTESLHSYLSGKKPVFVNMFASWCGPCQLETPDIVETFKAYSKRIGFVGINMTSQETSVNDVKDFLKRYHIAYPVLLDESGEVLNHYAVSAFPTSFLIDSRGTIVARKTGMFASKAELEKFLNQVPKSS